MKNNVLAEINEVLKRIDEKELNKLIKNLYSISSSGFWEDSNTTVILVEYNGVLNKAMAGFWSLNTDEKLIKYHGYTRKELRGE